MAKNVNDQTELRIGHEGNQQIEALLKERNELSEALAQTQAQLAAALMRVEAATRVIERLLRERQPLTQEESSPSPSPTLSKESVGAAEPASSTTSRAGSNTRGRRTRSCVRRGGSFQDLPERSAKKR
jgi:ABC-type transporter Mla subunit MlaD